MRRCRTRPTRAGSTCTPACATPSAAGSCACTASASRFRWRWWPTCRRRWASRARGASSTCWPTSPRAWPGRPGAPATASASSAATSACAPTCCMPQTRSRGAGSRAGRRLRALQPRGRARHARCARRTGTWPPALAGVPGVRLPFAAGRARAPCSTSLAHARRGAGRAVGPAEFALDGARAAWRRCVDPESGQRRWLWWRPALRERWRRRTTSARRGAAAGLFRAHRLSAAVHRGRLRCRRGDAPLPRMNDAACLLSDWAALSGWLLACARRRPRRDGGAARRGERAARLRLPGRRHRAARSVIVHVPDGLALDEASAAAAGRRAARRSSCVAWRAATAPRRRAAPRARPRLPGVPRRRPKLRTLEMPTAAAALRRRAARRRKCASRPGR